MDISETQCLDEAPITNPIQIVVINAFLTASLFLLTTTSGWGIFAAGLVSMFGGSAITLALLFVAVMLVPEMRSREEIDSTDLNPTF